MLPPVMLQMRNVLNHQVAVRIMADGAAEQQKSFVGLTRTFANTQRSSTCHRSFSGFSSVFRFEVTGDCRDATNGSKVLSGKALAAGLFALATLSNRRLAPCRSLRLCHWLTVVLHLSPPCGTRRLVHDLNI